jgi:epoxyqueuosine reductase
MTAKKFTDLSQLALQIKQWGLALGFQALRIADTDVREADEHLQRFLDSGYQGTMTYLEKNRELRRDPAKLVPGTQRVIMISMNYLPDYTNLKIMLKQPMRAYIARYALGRDYHRVLRKRLAKLAKQIEEAVGVPVSTRPFADSAPIFEKELARKSGLGWMGKNTLIMNRQAGSWFVLGALFINLPLPVDEPTSSHCGSCTACLDICPTNAFVAPYVLNASRCISYLTIENKGPIPEEFRRLIGNRIFGCDDCQIICPWNKFAKLADIPDFLPRHRLDCIDLLEIFAWSEEEYLQKTEGSAIRRVGYAGWLRNIAVALGNAPANAEVVMALQTRSEDPDPMVREHVLWALAEQRMKDEDREQCGC